MLSADSEALFKISLTLSVLISGPVIEYLYPENKPTTNNTATGQNATISKSADMVRDIFIGFLLSLLISKSFLFPLSITFPINLIILPITSPIPPHFFLFFPSLSFLFSSLFTSAASIIVLVSLFSTFPFLSK